MVKAWREAVVIPTYKPGKPEKNPIFLEKRVYQGSSGVVYPYPVIESIADEKEDVEYQAIWLENEYIKVMILPELGGRVQMAYDKIKQRHFIYYNQVIKPALVGLAGPWISGGIEFNWPQHHRPSTYMPVDSTIEENADGSVTVWVNEMERMFHQKGMAGFTLRPGCAYLEIKGRAINRTPLPQTFLWWANPAVKVNDFYQSVFPQDVNAVFDHGKRAVSSFPIATGTYYKMDYSAGVDISNYKNIKVPTSYMAVNSKYNFEGGYENDTKGGMLHVASHHFSPGKKQWTWGNGDFGRAWDRALTDEDGPYIELMAGVYTENQPDFTWLAPYEEKIFTQYFMPYRELGIVKNASKDLIMNVEDGVLKVLATSKMTVRIKAGSLDREVELSPEEVFIERIDNVENLEKVEIYHKDGRLLLSWEPLDDDIRPIPDSAEAALRPEEIKTTEQLYLTGLHLEQYRHATFRPTDYYEEALRRDPLDVRSNNAMGLWLMRNGQAAKAESYFRRAVKVLQKRNPNPYDGEPIFNLALSLQLQAGLSDLIEQKASVTSGSIAGSPKLAEAYEWFNKATWNAAWADPAFFHAACISTMQGRYFDALEEIDKCLIHNAHNHRARALKATLLRILGKKDEALAWIEESLKIDLFNYGCLFEKALLENFDNPDVLDILDNVENLDKIGNLENLRTLMRRSETNYEELMLDYMAFGRWQEALAIEKMAEEEGINYPLLHYYAAYCAAQANHKSQIINHKLNAAASAPTYCCFPNTLECVNILRWATEQNPADARAPYYLGCFFYAKRQYADAIDLWNISKERDPQFPTVWRNLSLALYNKLGEKEKAVEYLERAFTLDETDARLFMELDQLYKAMLRPHAERLAKLEAHLDLVSQRDDLILEHATLLNLTGQHEKAMEIIDNHQFHVWEGGEGKVSGQYQLARVELAKKILAATVADGFAVGQERPVLDGSVVELLTQCLDYPHNLGEGKLHGAQENDFYYLLGLAYEKLGNMEKARECWQRGTEGPTDPAPALYYNDAKPDKIFYAALCYQKLGQQDKANGLFYKLINFGKNHLFDEVRMDYFAVSLPDLLVWDGDLTETNRIHCLYMLALGNYGMGNKEKAEKYLAEAEKLNPNHLGLIAFRSFINFITTHE